VEKKGEELIASAAQKKGAAFPLVRGRKKLIVLAGPIDKKKGGKEKGGGTL